MDSSRNIVYSIDDSMSSASVSSEPFVMNIGNVIRNSSHNLINSDIPEISDLERGLRILRLEKYLEILQKENISPEDFKEGLSHIDLRQILNIPLGDSFKIVKYFINTNY